MANRKHMYWQKVQYCVWCLLTLLPHIKLGNGQGWGQFPQVNMCSRDTSYNNNVVISDGTENNRHFTEEECICLINKRVQALIQFKNIKFDCVPPRTWQMEFYYDGCLEKAITCDDEEDNEFFIDYPSTVRNIHIRLKRTVGVGDSGIVPGSYYYLEVLSTAAVTSTRSSRIMETVCGLPLESINATNTTAATGIIQTHCRRDYSDIPLNHCGAPPGGQTTSTATTQSTAPEAPTTTSSPSSTSTTEPILTPSVAAQSSKKDDSIIDNPAYLGAIIGGGVVLLILIIIVFVVLCRRGRRHSGEEKDSESVYSYSRSLPGSVNKDMQTANKTIDKHREKEERKREKKEERERKREEKRRMEDSKKHVYDSHIAPITYDNPAYLSGTQTSMPDFIPIPPAPPQENGYVQNNPVYAKANKDPKKNKKDKKDKSKKNKEKRREIAVMNGGSVPYGYYDKVVDSEFSFMEDDMYGGGKQGKY